MLVHPGGPFWAKKDAGAWSIPKGECSPDEDPLEAAKREFAEETGQQLPEGVVRELGSVKVSSSKMVFAWALETDFDTKHVKSDTFEMEWPPKSGQKQAFPEVDKAAWFSLSVARTKINKGQLPLLDTLATTLNVSTDNVQDAHQKTGPQISLF